VYFIVRSNASSAVLICRPQ